MSKLPGALSQTEQTLAKVDTLGGELGPTLEALRPPFRKLDDAPTRRCCRSCARPRLRSATRSGRSRASPGRTPRTSAWPRATSTRRRPDLTHFVQQAQPPLQHRRLQPERGGGADGRHLQQATARARRATSTGSRGPARTPSRCSAQRTPRARSGGSSWAGVGCDTLTAGGVARCPIVALLEAPGHAAVCGQLDGQGNPQPTSASPRWCCSRCRCSGCCCSCGWPSAARSRCKPEGYRVKVALPGGGHAGAGGRRAAGRRERRQGEEEGARQGRQRDDRGARAQGAVRAAAPRTRGRSCGRRRCSARPTWSWRRASARRPMLAGRRARCRGRRWSRRWSWTRSSRRSTSRRGMAFQEWVRELSAAIKGGRGQDLNDAFGNLEGVRGGWGDVVARSWTSRRSRFGGWSRTRVWCSGRSTSARVRCGS